MLDLGLCGRGMTDKLLIKAFADPSKASGLRQLSIRGAYRITDAGVVAAAKAAPKVDSLELTSNARVTAEGARAVAEACGNRRAPRFHPARSAFLLALPSLATALPSAAEEAPSLRAATCVEWAARPSLSAGCVVRCLSPTAGSAASAWTTARPSPAPPSSPSSRAAAPRSSASASPASLTSTTAPCRPAHSLPVPSNRMSTPTSDRSPSGLCGR